MRTFRNQKEAWDHMYGSSEDSRLVKEEAEAMFSRMFKAGHDTSIRHIAASCAEQVRNKMPLNESYKYLFQNLGQVHPDAFEFLLTYGRDYKPYDWSHRTPHLQKRQPQLGKCFKNTLELVTAYNHAHPENPDMCYVEGIVFGPFFAPMLHAWATYELAGTIAHDWTFYTTSRWNRYFGIAVTFEEYSECCRFLKPDNPLEIVLFDTEHFAQVRPCLEEILKKREVLL